MKDIDSYILLAKIILALSAIMLVLQVLGLIFYPR